jgi:hypothetical protein
MSNIIGAQKRNLLKKFNLLPAANEYLVFLITFIHLSVLKNGNMANMSTFKNKTLPIQIYVNKHTSHYKCVAGNTCRGTL